MSERFRIKSVLEDGRKVYMSKRGRIDVLDRSGAERVLRMRSDGPDKFAYTSDLAWYGSRELFEPRGIRMVGVVLTVSESASDPIDREAFVLGGVLAHEAGDGE